MLFNSSEFLIFFPIVLILYYISPMKYRWVLLLVSSYYFYMAWKAQYIVLIFSATLVGYLTGLIIFKAQTIKFKRIVLVLGLACNLGILIVFKYFNFFVGSLNFCFGKVGFEHTIPILDLVLPMGISFYIFQSLSYTIDVYRGKEAPEKHFGYFALYISYFPQLVAGPIERSSNLLPQFRQDHDFDYERFTLGIKRMVWGFFKKVVIADKVAIAVNFVYNNPEHYSGLPLVMATVLFAVQIYCDFSGYTDIAIGAAQTMGIKLMENFERPYFSKSISEFWKRWHISLSTWFKDYVYISLGGNRVRYPRYLINLMVTFTISGLWHGANWTFVIWGGVNGLYLIIETFLRSYTGLFAWIDTKKHLAFVKIMQTGITFALTCFAWIFFRANSISDAFYIVNHLFSDFSKWLSVKYIWSSAANMGLGKFEFFAVLIMIGLLLIKDLLDRDGKLFFKMSKSPVLFKYSCYYAILLCIIIFGVFKESQFIYFQF